MMMNTALICPNCKFENSADAHKCARCGAALPDRSIETIPVADLAGAVRRPELTPAMDLRPGMLALYIMGEKEPILLEGQKTATLGRIVFGEPAPTVDLTDYHGRLLGVSRHHAAIHFMDTGFTIEDLGSSNGTWLNDSRLPANHLMPLHSGDLIRLGQLVLFAHFQEAVAPGLVNDLNGDTRPMTPVRPVEIETDIRAMSLTLTGRPGRVDIRPDVVIASLSYAPEPTSLPEGAPPLFKTPRLFTVYIPVKLWKKVETALDDPHDQLIISGACAYDTEAGRIAILATHASTKHIETKRATLISRRQKRHKQLFMLKPGLRTLK